jgi:hypothetical protein
MSANRTQIGTCARCNGTGNIRAFNHNANGRCFACTGTGILTITISEVDAAAMDASRRRQWLSTLDTLTVNQAMEKIRALSDSDDRLWNLRDTCAGWDAPGARMAYWCACTLLRAWPSRPLPESWIDEA